MILLVTPDADRATGLSLACSPEGKVHHLDEAEPNPAELLGYVKGNDVDLVFLGPGLEPGTTLSLTRDLVRSVPGIGVIIVAHEDNVDVVRTGFRAGAADVIGSQTGADEVQQIIVAVRARLKARRQVGPAASPDANKSRVITTFSLRGGVGRSVVTAATAWFLEQVDPGEVVAVDLDLQSGDLAASFAMPDDLTLASLAGRVGEIDSAAVKALLRKVEDGPHVLAAPNSLTASAKVGAELVGEVIDILVDSFKYVVVDTSSHITEVSVAALDKATDVVIVVAPDAPSVRAVSRAADALDQLGIADPARHLVVNRATDRYGMSIRDIETVTGLAPICQIPASKELAMAIDSGRKFSEVTQPRGALAKAIKPLIGALTPGSKTSGRSGSFFAKLR